jgi:hypothetical protein
VAVWLVAAAGRARPAPLWHALVARVGGAGDVLDAEVEVVPLDLVDVVLGPDGQASGTDLALRADSPAAPELLGGRDVPADGDGGGRRVTS